MSSNSLQLGKLTVPVPVMLSPMAGVTNWPFRVLCRRYGSQGLYVAEMITARALVEGNPKAVHLCEFAPSEEIRSLQLYGVNPAVMEKAARIVVDGNMADHLDLNFGCPVPKVTRRGGGSALPWKSNLLTEIIRRVVKVCEPSGIPVTAKFRVGIDDEHETFLQSGRIAQEEGCAAVTLHARTTSQYYGGQADWTRITQLVEVLDIPVFGNGDIWSGDDAMNMLHQTGCAGIAIGRGCQGRPWLFADIKAAFEGREDRLDPSFGAVKSIILHHASLLTEFYQDESMAIRDLRKHLAWYCKGYPVGSATRRALMTCTTREELEVHLEEIDPQASCARGVVDQPRGRTRFARKVHLPQDWLKQPVLTEEERSMLFGDDPLEIEE